MVRVEKVVKKSGGVKEWKMGGGAGRECNDEQWTKYTKEVPDCWTRNTLDKCIIWQEKAKTSSPTL